MTSSVQDSIPVAASPPSADGAATLPARTVAVLQAEIDFIPNSAFPSQQDRPDEPDEIVEATLRESAASAPGPADLPGHLSRLCEEELLTHQQEIALFREMNFLKFRAHQLRCSLNPEQPDAQSVAAIEDRLAKALIIRDHLIKANIRLVISIVKKLVTPQVSFDDLLSDGIVTLMKAVEKFDFDRGFRFSTYAYRSIARNAYRRIANHRKEEARYASDAAESDLEQEDGRSSSSLTDQAWGDLRQLAASMLDRLDRRERFVIRSRYALGAHRKVRTLQNLAGKLGISKERTRQIEQRALGKLRAMAAEAEVDDLMITTVL